MTPLPQKISNELRIYLQALTDELAMLRIEVDKNKEIATKYNLRNDIKLKDLTQLLP